MVSINVCVIHTGVGNCVMKNVVTRSAKMVDNAGTKHAFARRALLEKRATFVSALRIVCPMVVASATVSVSVILGTRVKVAPFVTSSMVNAVTKQKSARAISLMLRTQHSKGKGTGDLRA